MHSPQHHHPPPPPARAHGKRRDPSYIPRPPNAFILFRCAFIKEQNVPGKVEGNHSRLSKIIGLCWKQLSREERAKWEARAVVAQAEHRAHYPDWRFRPGANALAKQRVQEAQAQAQSEAGPSSRAPARKRSARSIKETTPTTDADVEADPDDVDNDDDEAPTKGKGKSKARARTAAREADKGKARGRVPASLDETRCAKIAGFVAEGIRGKELEVAVEQWEDDHRIRLPSVAPSSAIEDVKEKAMKTAKGRARLAAGKGRSVKGEAAFMVEASNLINDLGNKTSPGASYQTLINNQNQFFFDPSGEVRTDTSITISQSPSSSAHPLSSPVSISHDASMADLPLTHMFKRSASSAAGAAVAASSSTPLPLRTPLLAPLIPPPLPPPLGHGHLTATATSPQSVGPSPPGSATPLTAISEELSPASPFAQVIEYRHAHAHSYGHAQAHAPTSAHARARSSPHVPQMPFGIAQAQAHGHGQMSMARQEPQQSQQQNQQHQQQHQFSWHDSEARRRHEDSQAPNMWWAGSNAGPGADPAGKGISWTGVEKGEHEQWPDVGRMGYDVPSGDAFERNYMEHYRTYDAQQQQQQQGQDPTNDPKWTNLSAAHSRQGLGLVLQDQYKDECGTAAPVIADNAHSASHDDSPQVAMNMDHSSAGGAQSIPSQNHTQVALASPATLSLPPLPLESRGYYYQGVAVSSPVSSPYASSSFSELMGWAGEGWSAESKLVQEHLHPAQPQPQQIQHQHQQHQHQTLQHPDPQRHHPQHQHQGWPSPTPSLSPPASQSPHQWYSPHQMQQMQMNAPPSVPVWGTAAAKHLMPEWTAPIHAEPGRTSSGVGSGASGLLLAPEREDWERMEFRAAGALGVHHHLSPYQQQQQLGMGAGMNFQEELRRANADCAS